MAEQDCFNALSGRVIQSIEFEDEGEDIIIISTHDGLSFRICSDYSSPDDTLGGYSWIEISQVDNG